jgi:hypothetical protein
VLDWIRNPRLPEVVELSTAALAGLPAETTGPAPAAPEPESDMPQY